MLPPRVISELSSGLFTGNVAFPIISDQEFPNTCVVVWLVFTAVGVTNAGTASWTRERRTCGGPSSSPDVATPAAASCGGVVLPCKTVICKDLISLIPVRL